MRTATKRSIDTLGKSSMGENYIAIINGEKQYVPFMLKTKASLRKARQYFARKGFSSDQVTFEKI